jgi:hypothetical protein
LLSRHSELFKTAATSGATITIIVDNQDRTAAKNGMLTLSGTVEQV